MRKKMKRQEIDATIGTNLALSIGKNEIEFSLLNDLEAALYEQATNNVLPWPKGNA